MASEEWVGLMFDKIDFVTLEAVPLGILKGTATDLTNWRRLLNEIQIRWWVLMLLTILDDRLRIFCLSRINIFRLKILMIHHTR